MTPEFTFLDIHDGVYTMSKNIDYNLIDESENYDLIYINIFQNNYATMSFPDNQIAVIKKQDDISNFQFEADIITALVRRIQISFSKFESIFNHPRLFIAITDYRRDAFSRILTFAQNSAKMVINIEKTNADNANILRKYCSQDCEDINKALKVRPTKTKKLLITIKLSDYYSETRKITVVAFDTDKNSASMVQGKIGYDVFDLFFMHIGLLLRKFERKIQNADIITFRVKIGEFNVQFLNNSVKREICRIKYPGEDWTKIETVHYDREREIN